MGDDEESRSVEGLQTNRLAVSSRENLSASRTAAASNASASERFRTEIALGSSYPSGADWA